MGDDDAKLRGNINIEKDLEVDSIKQNLRMKKRTGEEFEDGIACNNMTCKAIGLGTKNRNLCCYISVHQMTTGLCGLDMTLKEADSRKHEYIQQSCSWIISDALPFSRVILVIICDRRCSLQTELPAFPCLSLHILLTLSQEAQDIPKLHWAAPSPRTGSRYFDNPVIKSTLWWALFSIILTLGVKPHPTTDTQTHRGNVLDSQCHCAVPMETQLRYCEVSA